MLVSGVRSSCAAFAAKARDASSAAAVRAVSACSRSSMRFRLVATSATSAGPPPGTRTARSAVSLTCSARSLSRRRGSRTTLDSPHAIAPAPATAAIPSSSTRRRTVATAVSTGSSDAANCIVTGSRTPSPVVVVPVTE